MSWKPFGVQPLALRSMCIHARLFARVSSNTRDLQWVLPSWMSSAMRNAISSLLSFLWPPTFPVFPRMRATAIDSKGFVASETSAWSGSLLSELSLKKFDFPTSAASPHCAMMPNKRRPEHVNLGMQVIINAWAYKTFFKTPWDSDSSEGLEEFGSILPTFKGDMWRIWGHIHRCCMQHKHTYIYV